MKPCLLFFPFFLFLCSCTDNDVASPGSGNGPGGQFGGGSSSPNGHDHGGDYFGRGPSVSFVKQGLDGGTADLFLRIDGRDYLIERDISTFRRTSAREFGNMGIPHDAMAAGLFWSQGDHEESGQGVYAKSHDGHIDVFTGFYEPGSMHDDRWRRTRSIDY